MLLRDRPVRSRTNGSLRILGVNVLSDSISFMNPRLNARVGQVQNGNWEERTYKSYIISSLENEDLERGLLARGGEARIRL